MSEKVFLVSVTTVIPVLAHSEEDAMDLVIANPDFATHEVHQALEAFEEELEHRHELAAELLTKEMCQKDFYWLDVVPWGDDTDETIASRLGIEQDAADDDDEEPAERPWMEPNHVED